MSTFNEKSVVGARRILEPTGNRVVAVEDLGRKTNTRKKQMGKPRIVIKLPPASTTDTHRERGSSSDSSSSSSRGGGFTSVMNSKNGYLSKRVVKMSSGVYEAAKIAADGLEISPANTRKVHDDLPVKRCDWITPNSEPIYAAFHDEEWGVPVHDDAKLFELLVLSQALAELSWPEILTNRPIFRKLFENFDPSSVANLGEERLLSIRGNTPLSEQKLRAVVENAKQLLKIRQELGSFSNYCWGFANQKAMKSGFNHAREVPGKTPKAEAMSKDMQRRGFRCVGPRVVYSFMQAAGLVNDHLLTCFRHNQLTPKNSASIPQN